MRGCIPAGSSHTRWTPELFTTTVARKTPDWNKFSLEDGPVYHDESRVGGNWTHPRAAWSAVQTDTNGTETKTLWGVVDKHMEQSDDIAKHVGLMNRFLKPSHGASLSLTVLPSAKPGARG